MNLPPDAMLGLIEPSPGDPLFWLSFADPGRPEGTQFLGVAIIQGSTLAAAITRSHLLKVNPGGQVGILGPIEAEYIAPEWRDRLLSAAEIDAIPEPEELRD